MDIAPYPDVKVEMPGIDIDIYPHSNDNTSPLQHDMGSADIENDSGDDQELNDLAERSANNA